MSFIERHMTIPCSVINRIEAQEPDAHGNPVYVDDPPIPTMCFVAPRGGMETQDGRAVTEGWTVYLGPQLAGRINSFSYIDVEGYGLMEVEGVPNILRSLADHFPHHVEVTTRRSSA